MIIDDPKKQQEMEDVSQDESGKKGGEAEAETSDALSDTGDMSFENDTKDEEE